MSKLYISSHPHFTTFSFNNLMDLHYAANGEKGKTRDINLCQASQSFMIYILAAGTVKQAWPLDLRVDPKPGA